MNNSTTNLDKNSIAELITLEKLMKKYKRERSRKKMQPHYERMMAEVTELAEPKLISMRFGAEIVAEMALEKMNDMVGGYFALCTLGDAIDKRYAEHSVDDLALAAILDEIALAWIVAITRTFHQQLRQQFDDPNFKIGPAHRPGLGRIPIETQAIVFSHLPADKIGVTLSEFMVMEPARSTSLVIPILKK
ncbi:MAG: hypothetical protein AAF490_01805 [Chloroflexota bacterium]